MNISVIIVCLNGKAHLKKCLKSIKEKTIDIEYEVIVSDNGSTDGSQTMIQKEFPWVHLIENHKNLGFGTANNRGAAIATGQVLLFLNDDTILKENSLKIIYAMMLDRQNIGVLGCHLINLDGSHQDSIRRYPKFWDQLIILTKLHNFFPTLRPIKRYLAQDIDYSKEQNVDQVMGACMAIRANVFKTAQGFDEHFFVWFEEVDLQKRIYEKQKLPIVFSPNTEIIHLKGATFSQIMSVKSQLRLNRSMRYYFYKHHGLLQAIVLTAAQPYSIVLSFLVHVYKVSGRDIKKLKHGQN